MPAQQLLSHTSVSTTSLTLHKVKSGSPEGTASLDSATSSLSEQLNIPHPSPQPPEQHLRPQHSAHRGAVKLTGGGSALGTTPRHRSCAYLLLVVDSTALQHIKCTPQQPLQPATKLEERKALCAAAKQRRLIPFQYQNYCLPDYSFLYF